MPITTKNWEDFPSTATPVTAAALEDMESRVGAYADNRDAVLNIQMVQYTDAQLAARVPFINVVEDHGAVGDGTTNDRAAIQAAIDDANSRDRGATIFVPRGRYLIGTPGLTWPNQGGTAKVSTLLGEGEGGVSGGPTQFLRNGNYSILTTAFTNEAAGSIFFNMESIEFVSGEGDGGTNGASYVNTQPLVTMNFVANSHFRNVRFKDTGGTGLYARVLWNVHFENCWWTNCGKSGSSNPALNVSSHPSISQGSNTVMFVSCEWEGCNSDAVLVDGPDQTVVCALFDNCHLERNIGRNLVIGRTHGTAIQNSYIHASENANPTIAMGVNSPAAGDSGNKVIGNHIVSAGTTKPSYHIDCVAGQGHIINSNCFYGSTSGTEMVRLQTGVGNVCILGNLQPNWMTDTATVEDNRTNKTGSLILNAAGAGSAANGTTP